MKVRLCAHLSGPQPKIFRLMIDQARHCSLMSRQLPVQTAKHQQSRLRCLQTTVGLEQMRMKCQ